MTIAAPMIILNGPIRHELDFNSGQGSMRPERRANVSISRFLRLEMVNVSRFILGSTDMASFGRNYVPVLAENEEESPWTPLSVDRGFNEGDNVITLILLHEMSDHYELSGDAPVVLKSLAIEATRILKSTVTPLTRFGPYISPIIGVSSLVASVLDKGGYTKKHIKEYLFEHARVTAEIFDEDLEKDHPGLTACKAVELGLLPGLFCESEDPDRMLPLVRGPDDFQIVVAGSMIRNRSFIVPQAGAEGLAVSKEIKLPGNWEQLLKKKR